MLQEPKQDLMSPRLPRCARKYCAHISRSEFDIPDSDIEKCINSQSNDRHAKETLIASKAPNATKIDTGRVTPGAAGRGLSNGTSTEVPSPPRITNTTSAVPPFRAPISSSTSATSPTVRPAALGAATASPSPNAVGPAAALCDGGTVVVFAVVVAAAGALL
jgi:hypothetical protein